MGSKGIGSPLGVFRARCGSHRLSVYLSHRMNISKAILIVKGKDIAEFDRVIGHSSGGSKGFWISGSLPKLANCGLE